jgi:hypothetical protein
VAIFSTICSRYCKREFMVTQPIVVRDLHPRCRIAAKDTRAVLQAGNRRGGYKRTAM